MRIVIAGVIAVSAAIGLPVEAGVYSSIDTREETRYDKDYRVFGQVLDVLSTIPAKSPATNPPIRQRYLLIEALAPNGRPRLDTLEEKLNFSAVLIRRGRALEAKTYLAGVLEEKKEYRTHFLILSQYATAHFLTGAPEFEGHSLLFIRKALDNWPKTWEDLKENQKGFLINMGWHGDIDFDRYHRCDEHLERLMKHRLNEKKLRAKKQETKDVLDPIFLNAKNEPIPFLNDKGEYEAGQIAKADKDSLGRRDFVEDVMQLLIWMPNDERLLWLLAESLNASAMDEKGKPEDKHRVIHSANRVFLRLLDFKNPVNYAHKEIRRRHEVIQAYVDLNPIDLIKLPGEKNDETESSLGWWRTVGASLGIGVMLGMFALWQIQEMRRRRQARAVHA